MQAAIELRQLATFVLACQNPTTAQTARELGIAHSTLSATLNTLEDQLGLKLFQRIGRHLYPRAPALWLFQQSLTLLQLERFARARLDAGSDAPVRPLRVELDLSFSIGRFSKALSAAVGALHAEFPDLQPMVEFLRNPNLSLTTRGRSLDAVRAAEEDALAIRYESADRPAGPAEQLLHEDPWVIACQQRPAGGKVGDHTALHVLDMAPELLQDIRSHATRAGFLHRLHFLDREPIDLPRLLQESPDAGFLLPGSMISSRLGLVDPHVEPLAPALSSRVVVLLPAAPAPGVQAFLGFLRRELAGPGRNAIFTPGMTLRQLEYFNLAQRSGSVSAAARAMGHAQPTVTNQIRKLEETLGLRLFLREAHGLVLTDAGRRFLPQSEAIARDAQLLLQDSQEVALRTGMSISLGLLPSSGHDSLMTESIAIALRRFRQKFPHCRLDVLEKSRDALHDAVMQGTLSLAVLGNPNPLVPRIPLGASEPLSVVANPALGLEGRDSLPLAELCRLPLILAPKQFYMHRWIMDLAEAQKLRMVPDMQIGSLPLTIALLRSGPWCSVLPASAVREDLRRGSLTAIPIPDPGPQRAVSAIYSTERNLTVMERSLLAELRAALSEHNIPAPEALPGS